MIGVGCPLDTRSGRDGVLISGLLLLGALLIIGSVDTTDRAQAPGLWLVLTTAALLIGAGAAGSGTAAWLLLLVTSVPGATLTAWTGAFAQELCERATARLRSAGVALATAAFLAVAAVVAGAAA